MDWRPRATTRRGFLRLLSVVPGLPYFGAVPGKPRTIPIAVVNIAGYRFHEGPEIFSSLRTGEWLGLVREPGNMHDRNAVRVIAADSMIGYIPRLWSGALAALLDNGVRIHAHVARLRISAPPWKRVAITLTAEAPGYGPGRKL